MKYLRLTILSIFCFSPIISLSDSSESQKCFRLVKSLSNSNLELKKLIHPDYYLWDSWGIKEKDVFHLYAMSASRKFEPKERHQHAHWRHFVSFNNGLTWIDRGVLIKGHHGPLKHNKSIWSGSIFVDSKKRYLAAFTGLIKGSDVEQEISLAIGSSASHFQKYYPSVLNHRTNRKVWQDKGYYLDSLKNLGRIEGELDGTIQALRDPFLLEVSNNQYEMFFASKVKHDGKIRSSVGRAFIKIVNGTPVVELKRPILLPDADKFTQVELPNVVKREDGRYLWMISTTKRTSEKQSISEVAPDTRIYLSDGLDAPLRPYWGKGSVLQKTSGTGLYGLNLIRGSYRDGKFLTSAFGVGESYSGPAFSLPGLIQVDLKNRVISIYQE